MNNDSQPDLFNISDTNRHRITQRKKDANKKQWYKDMADLLDNHSHGSNTSLISFGGVSEFMRKKVNYDLFNNIINHNDFLYVCRPFGAEAGELPAKFTNRDITSGKIKVLLGMEMSMPFSWKVIATNEEATTRKEQEEYGRIKDFVIGEIMNPIKQQIQQQSAEQTKGQKLTPEEKQKIQEDIQSQIQTQTPDEVRRYMTREHQDPSEVMHQQILEYLLLKEKIAQKFNKGWKHSLISGTEVYHVGIFRGKPGVRVVNSLLFEYDKSPDLDGIEDGEWAVAEYRMTPSQVIADHGDELTDDEIDRIYEHNSSPSTADFTFQNEVTNINTIRVKHCTWKSLMKVGFLIYTGQDGKEEMDLVDENYKLDKEGGDIELQWEWVPQSHECWKILNDIYVHAGPVAGQNKDLENLFDCKLPYYGMACDSLNSVTTAPMDRMKAYQYYYNVILYRIELLMASDKGKILAANIKGLPKSAGINVNKFMYFMEANKIAWFNPTEEGNRGGGDVTNMVKEIDMSLASDISKYIQFAEFIKRECGNSVGVTPQMEAQIAADEAVTNTKQNLIQSSHIIKPYFESHNVVKANVLQALIETAKVAYSQSNTKTLSYVLDDMSFKLLKLDQGMLDGDTIGLFVSNSSKADDALQAIKQLGQAAMQNQQATLTDIIKIIKSNNINEAEELLEVSEQKRIEQEQASEKDKVQAQKDTEMRQDTLQREQWDHDKEMVVLKETERRKTEVQKAAEAALGYAKDTDQDDDGIPDVIEVMKHGLNVDIQNRKEDREDEQLKLDQDKFTHQKKIDNKKIEIDTKKLNKPSAK